MARRKDAGPYPRELLMDACWSICGPKFETYTEFLAELRQYLREVVGHDRWPADAVVLRAPRARVSPDCCNTDWDEQPVVTLTADDGEAFTAGELLWKVHNAFTDQLGDHHFFEGLNLADEQAAGKPPLYDIGLGS